jgi:hypothetical protein
VGQGVVRQPGGDVGQAGGLQLRHAFLLADEAHRGHVRLAFQAPAQGLALGLVQVGLEEDGDLRLGLDAAGGPVQVLQDQIEPGGHGHGHADDQDGEQAGHRRVQESLGGDLQTMEMVGEPGFHGTSFP